MDYRSVLLSMDYNLKETPNMAPHKLYNLEIIMADRIEPTSRVFKST